MRSGERRKRIGENGGGRHLNGYLELVNRPPAGKAIWQVIDSHDRAIYRYR